MTTELIIMTNTVCISKPLRIDHLLTFFLTFFFLLSSFYFHIANWVCLLPTRFFLKLTSPNAMKIPIRSGQSTDDATLALRGRQLAHDAQNLDKFKTIMSDPYHPDTNPDGFINMGTAENVRPRSRETFVYLVSSEHRP